MIKRIKSILYNVMIFQQAWQEALARAQAHIVYLSEIDLIHIQLFKSTPNLDIP
jgi:hypothetical protein